MIYTQFFEENTKGEVWTALGSDGVFILDGRNKLPTLIKDSEERWRKLSNLHPEYIGFKILRGDRLDDRNVCLYASNIKGG